MDTVSTVGVIPRNIVDDYGVFEQSCKDIYAKQLESNSMISMKCEILLNIYIIKRNVTFYILDNCMRYASYRLDILMGFYLTVDYSPCDI